MSSPAVLDSGFRAASLGYLKARRRNRGRSSSPAPAHHHFSFPFLQPLSFLESPSYPTHPFLSKCPCTWEGTALPPETPQSCWYLCVLRCHTAGMGAALLGTASELSRSAWRRGQASGQEKRVRENQKGEVEGCGKKKELWVVEGGGKGAG